MNEKNTLGLGLLGLGTVGCGVIKTLRRNGSEIAGRCGHSLSIVCASARDLSKKRPVDMDGIALHDDPMYVVNDERVDIVLELIGGIEPARQLIMAALQQGKRVVTANKALLAEHGHEIFAAAQQHHTEIAYEAAVAGGIPIIKVLREGLAANRIHSIVGIINGTSNYILSEMCYAQKSFQDALRDAQSSGYAEADPRLDIEGFDAAHKLALIAAVAFGMPLRYEQIYTEGVSAIDMKDMVYAAELDHVIKHVGIARRTSAGVELRVHPALLPQRSLLAHVDGVMNAFFVAADATGASLYYGAGAGAEPTASAILADVVDIARRPQQQHNPGSFHWSLPSASATDIPVVPMQEVSSLYYLRLKVEDRLGVLARLTTLLAQQGISIEAVSQKEPTPETDTATIVLLTHRVREALMDKAIAMLEQLDEVLDPVVRIRAETLD